MLGCPALSVSLTFLLLPRDHVENLEHLEGLGMGRRGSDSLELGFTVKFTLRPMRRILGPNSCGGDGCERSRPGRRRRLDRPADHHRGSAQAARRAPSGGHHCGHRRLSGPVRSAGFLCHCGMGAGTQPRCLATAEIETLHSAFGTYHPPRLATARCQPLGCGNRPMDRRSASAGRRCDRRRWEKLGGRPRGGPAGSPSGERDPPPGSRRGRPDQCVRENQRDSQTASTPRPAAAGRHPRYGGCGAHSAKHRPLRGRRKEG